MGFGADRFRLLVVLKRVTTTASEDDPIIFFIVFDTVCTVPFFLVFRKFWYPMKKCHPNLMRDFIYDK